MNLLKCNRIIFASSTMGEKAFTELFSNSTSIPGQQAQKFNRLILSGLQKNGMEVYCVSTPPVTKKSIYKNFITIASTIEDGVKYLYLPVLNISGLKNLFNIFGSFFQTFRLGCKEKSIIICDVLNVSAALGATVAAKLLKCPVVGIVTDVPELMVTGHTKKQVELVYKVIDRCTHYVFLTEPMNERMNRSNKPYTIIEAVCDGVSENDNHEHNNRSIYAGYLDEKYGIKTLVEAFIKANVSNQELHIYGDGPYSEELRRIQRSSDKIKYHGSVMISEVVAAEKEARLLINPRPTNEEFTKYSFPSKNMEYMASGTPVLTTRLPGIPDEYFEYVYYFSDESVDGMSNKIREVLIKDNFELIEKGIVAQQYVAMKKNSVVQTKKILNMLTEKA